MTNATIHALHFANLINSIDVSYADALGTKPMNMSAMNMDNDSIMYYGNNNNTMSDMKMDVRDSSSSNMKSMNKVTGNNSNSNTNETNTVVTNIAKFQTAKELTNNAIELFNLTIKQNIPSNATTDNGNVIEYSLKQLKNMIESKEPYYKIMGIIHGVIQTNTQDIFICH